MVKMDDDLEMISFDVFEEKYGIVYGGSIEDEDYFHDLNKVLNALIKGIYDSLEHVRKDYMVLRSSERHRYIFEGEYFGLSVNISGVTVSYDVRLKSEDSIIDELHVSYYDPLMVGFDNDKALLNKLLSDISYILYTGSNLTKMANDIQRILLLTPQQYIEH